MSNDASKVRNMIDEKDRKAELTLLVEMEKLTSQGAKRDFAKSIELSWDEYLHIKRKYSRVIERWRKENL